MKEVEGDLWKFWEAGEWICITTNGRTDKHGKAVMGRGVALEAKNRFPDLAKHLGALLGKFGNNAYHFAEHRLVTFPTKHDWKEKSNLHLIRRSAIKLMWMLDAKKIPVEKVYLPRPGCGNGGFEWSQIEPVLSSILDDRFIVVNKV